jgi:hypothetical protein
MKRRDFLLQLSSLIPAASIVVGVAARVAIRKRLDVAWAMSRLC